APQVLVQLLLRLFAEQLRKPLGGPAAGRVVLQADAQLGPSITGCGPEFHSAAVGDVGAIERTAGDALRRILDHFRVPPDTHAGGAARTPVRHASAERFARFEMP